MNEYNDESIDEKNTDDKIDEKNEFYDNYMNFFEKIVNEFANNEKTIKDFEEKIKALVFFSKISWIWNIILSIIVFIYIFIH